ncbi:uncharacterized protein BDZ99DRAFT_528087 [Mytilinidion resinicola]|uniref:HTH araC/xylS-type domain-containing protein n=1 Tax=Mytilinidion resinicola TaxID=574789 RepID=A0A6A6Y0W8_9PEZI|nr:uncharacterized protein BDZ99DRAFT_528087 [Mytilinidion resinicola]KAF2801875.1 hypothetical protein BDZ99DRAFT_528087 [Mytilinidion resinicola]
MSFTTPSTRWAALTTRDPAAYSAFIYAVKSTNCYCRPTCPARLARRANVVFYSSAAEAAKDGFRACKRCKPDAGDEKDAADIAFEKACSIIVDAVAEGKASELGLKELAKAVGLTPRYFHKVFKDRMGVTPAQYVKLKGEEMSTIGGLSAPQEEGKEDPQRGPSGGEQELGFDFDFGDLVNEEMMGGGEGSVSPEGHTPPLPDGQPDGILPDALADADREKQMPFYSALFTFDEMGLDLLDLGTFGGVDEIEHAWLNMEDDKTLNSLAPYDFNSGNYMDSNPFIIP